jgi:hypothetical protein
VTSSNKRPRGANNNNNNNNNNNSGAGESGKEGKVTGRKAAGRGAATRSSNSAKATDAAVPVDKKDFAEAECDEELIGQDVYRGAPLTVSVSDEEAPAVGQPFTAPATVSDGGLRDSQVLERRQLEAKHRMQWARAKLFMKDRMEAEMRDLEGGERSKSMFETACTYLFGQWGRRVESPRAVRTWLSSESSRRSHVEARIKALMLKFKHMVEDTARDQRIEASHLASAHGSSAVAKGQVPNGCCAVPDLVHVPCSFKLSVTVHGTDADTTFNVAA